MKATGLMKFMCKKINVCSFFTESPHGISLITDHFLSFEQGNRFTKSSFEALLTVQLDPTIILIIKSWQHDQNPNEQNVDLNDAHH